MKINKVVVFDLDDTLSSEIDFLKSAYNEIALKISDEICLDNNVIFNKMLNYYYERKNVFNEIIKEFDVSIDKMKLLH